MRLLAQVLNLHPDIGDPELRELFSPFGEVGSAVGWVGALALAPLALGHWAMNGTRRVCALVHRGLQSCILRGGPAAHACTAWVPLGSAGVWPCWMAGLCCRQAGHASLAESRFSGRLVVVVYIVIGARFAYVRVFAQAR
jgi:hypothetical protein